MKRSPQTNYERQFLVGLSMIGPAGRCGDLQRHFGRQLVCFQANSVPGIKGGQRVPDCVWYYRSELFSRKGETLSALVRRFLKRLFAKDRTNAIKSMRHLPSKLTVTLWHDFHECPVTRLETEGEGFIELRKLGPPIEVRICSNQPGPKADAHDCQNWRSFLAFRLNDSELRGFYRGAGHRRPGSAESKSSAG